MNKLGILLLGGLLGLCPAARASVSFEFIFNDGYGVHMSDNGLIVAGNTVGNYEPFRWSAASGFMPLGRATVPALGVGGGAPGISADGVWVASTIVDSTNSFTTQGLWSKDTGWLDLLPPSPPGAGIIDQSLADVWGMSGDGQTVVGLLWRQSGRAHALRWTSSGGAVDLGSTGQSSRADVANYDGSVIGGWDETPTGPRNAAVWVDGVETVLTQTEGFGEVHGVNPAGTLLLGYEKEYVTNMRAAALWHRTGNTWSAAQTLGVVPGTLPNSGIAIAYGASADGHIVVGFNSFAGDPFYTTGFIWTDTTGVVDVADFLAARNLTPENFTIQSLSAITPDGRTILGYGSENAAPYAVRSFLIHLDPAVSAVPIAGGETPALLTAGPNPTRGATTLSLDLPGAMTGELVVLDNAGRLVRRLASGSLAAGPHTFRWDARDESGSPVVAGVYYARFSAPSIRESRKLVMLR